MAPEGEDIDRRYGREKGEVRRMVVGGKANLEVVKLDFTWLTRFSMAEGWEGPAIREYSAQLAVPSDHRGRACPRTDLTGSAL